MTDPVPRVSIVIPAYNNADYLQETIDSVLAQTYTDFEVVVSDHSSTDGTAEVMRRYESDPRFTLLTTEAGGGALRNWNRVSQAARGTYLKLVCGDDLLYPEILRLQVEALDANPGATIAASPRDIVDANSRPVIRDRGLGGKVGTHPGAEIVRASVRAGTNLFGEPGCVLMRRADLEAEGWWDSRWPYLIDQTTSSRVALRGSFVGVGTKALAGFRISDSQWSVRLAKQQSEAAAGFHRWMHETHPEVVSRADVLVGNARARAMAAARRLAYIYLKQRMSRGVAA
jgi:glycosyltransferase involved in cell wall biosynthesis